MAVIGISVNNIQIVYIQAYTSSKDSFYALIKTYPNASVANRMYLQDKLMKYKMEAPSDLKAHIEEMRRTSVNIATLGSPISD